MRFVSMFSGNSNGRPVFVTGGALWLLVLLSLACSGAVPSSGSNPSRHAELPETAQSAHSPDCTADLERCITQAMQEVARLTFMGPNKEFDLPAGNSRVKGPKEAFLRARTGREILASGLSSGCGDNSLALAHLLEGMGIEYKLVDSVDLSVYSLATRYSGHVVVAVRDARQDRWVLADPSRRVILSSDWSLDTRVIGGHYYVGFLGSPEEFLAPERGTVKEFYARLLEQAPRSVWSDTLIGLTFEVDESLRTADGGYVNPAIPDFINRYEEMLSAYGITPRNRVCVRLVRGEDGYNSSLEQAADGSWVCHLGTKSAMSWSLLNYIERRIRKGLTAR